MITFSSEQYQSHLQKVPEDVKNTLYADETAQAIKKIALRYGVGENSFDIAAQIGYTLVGLVPVKKFIQALQSGASLDDQTAKDVAQDIRSEIFAPVAQSLARMQNEAEKSWEEAVKEERYMIESRARGMVGDALHEEEADQQSATDSHQQKNAARDDIMSHPEQSEESQDSSPSPQNDTPTTPHTQATPAESSKTILDVEEEKETEQQKAPNTPQTQSTPTPEPPSEKPQPPQEPTPQPAAPTSPQTPETPEPQTQKPAETPIQPPQPSTPPPANLPTNEPPAELDNKLKDEIFPKPE